MSGLRWLAVVALVVGACGSEDEPEPLPTGPMAYQVRAYDYAFDLETRRAAVRVTFEITTGGDCLSIPFRATGLGDVLLDDEPVGQGSGLDGEVLTVCGDGWRDGEVIALSAGVTVPEETWGDSQVGYSVTPDIEGNPFHYMVSWVGGCDRFGPCDSRPDAFAHYTFTVAHPDGYTVLCPGALTPGATESRCEFTLDGGPTYSAFGFAAGPSWEVHDLGTWGDVRVTLYDMPSTGIVDDLDVDAAKGFLAFMEESFGPYPYGDELRFATGPTYWFGFEHPGSVVLYDQLNRVVTTRNSLRHTTNHEIAHMWAGDQTTLATTYDFVWKEAMAEYLSHLYEADEYGDQTAPPYWKQLASGGEYYPVPAEAPPLIDYYGDVYGAGPLVLFRQIEFLYDRDTVLEAIRGLLGAQQAIGIDDIELALENATGADLTNYFDRWVYGEGVPVHPEFSVTVDDNGDGSYDVTVAQVFPDELFGCAFVVQLRDADGNPFDVPFNLGVEGMQSATQTVTPGFVVAEHRFDPYRHSLAFEADAAMVTPPPGVWMDPFVAPPRDAAY